MCDISDHKLVNTLVLKHLYYVHMVKFKTLQHKTYILYNFIHKCKRYYCDTNRKALIIYENLKD